MTATITPPSGMPGTVRNDPELRLTEYKSAFTHYLNIADSLVDEIVLLENSDADLSPFRAITSNLRTRKTISLINTNSSYPPDKGKVYAEFFMLDSGIRQIAPERATKRFWKVTGRLIIANMGNMIAGAPSHYDVYCDMRDVPLIGDFFGGNQWMDFRLFSFTLPAYHKFFEGRYQIPPVSVESKEFFTYLMSEQAKGNIDLSPRFLDQPIFYGYSGGTNSSYHGWRYRNKALLRRVARRYVPRLWI